MKLLMVMSIRENREKVVELLQVAGVNRFSISHISGYKGQKETISWFTSALKNPKTNSILFFSFTSKEIADKAIEEINNCNIETENPFPAHAFVLDVESFSNLV